MLRFDSPLKKILAEQAAPANQPEKQAESVASIEFTDPLHTLFVEGALANKLSNGTLCGKDINSIIGVIKTPPLNTYLAVSLRGTTETLQVFLTRKTDEKNRLKLEEYKKNRLEKFASFILSGPEAWKKLERDIQSAIDFIQEKAINIAPGKERIVELIKSSQISFLSDFNGFTPAAQVPTQGVSSIANSEDDEEKEKKAREAAAREKERKFFLDLTTKLITSSLIKLMRSSQGPIEVLESHKDELKAFCSQFSGRYTPRAFDDYRILEMRVNGETKEEVILKNFKEKYLPELIEQKIQLVYEGNLAATQDEEFFSQFTWIQNLSSEGLKEVETPEYTNDDFETLKSSIQEAYLIEARVVEKGTNEEVIGYDSSLTNYFISSFKKEQEDSNLANFIEGKLATLFKDKESFRWILSSWLEEHNYQLESRKFDQGINPFTTRNQDLFEEVMLNESYLQSVFKEIKLINKETGTQSSDTAAMSALKRRVQVAKPEIIRQIISPREEIIRTDLKSKNLEESVFLKALRSTLRSKLLEKSVKAEFINVINTFHSQVQRLEDLQLGKLARVFSLTLKDLFFNNGFNPPSDPLKFFLSVSHEDQINHVFKGINGDLVSRFFGSAIAKDKTSLGKQGLISSIFEKLELEREEELARQKASGTKKRAWLPQVGAEAAIFELFKNEVVYFIILDQVEDEIKEFFARSTAKGETTIDSTHKNLVRDFLIDKLLNALQKPSSPEKNPMELNFHGKREFKSRVNSSEKISLKFDPEIKKFSLDVPLTSKSDSFIALTKDKDLNDLFLSIYSKEENRNTLLNSKPKEQFAVDHLHGLFSETVQVGATEFKSRNNLAKSDQEISNDARSILNLIGPKSVRVIQSKETVFIPDFTLFASLDQPEKDKVFNIFTKYGVLELTSEAKFIALNKTISDRQSADTASSILPLNNTFYNLLNKMFKDFQADKAEVKSVNIATQIEKVKNQNEYSEISVKELGIQDIAVKLYSNSREVFKELKEKKDNGEITPEQYSESISKLIDLFIESGELFAAGKNLYPDELESNDSPLSIKGKRVDQVVGTRNKIFKVLRSNPIFHTNLESSRFNRGTTAFAENQNFKTRLDLLPNEIRNISNEIYASFRDDTSDLNLGSALEEAVDKTVGDLTTEFGFLPPGFSFENLKHSQDNQLLSKIQTELPEFCKKNLVSALAKNKVELTEADKTKLASSIKTYLNGKIFYESLPVEKLVQDIAIYMAAADGKATNKLKAKPTKKKELVYEEEDIDGSTLSTTYLIRDANERAKGAEDLSTVVKGSAFGITYLAAPLTVSEKIEFIHWAKEKSLIEENYSPYAIKVLDINTVEPLRAALPTFKEEKLNEVTTQISSAFGDESKAVGPVNTLAQVLSSNIKTELGAGFDTGELFLLRNSYSLLKTCEENKITNSGSLKKFLDLKVERALKECFPNDLKSYLTFKSSDTKNNSVKTDQENSKSLKEFYQKLEKKQVPEKDKIIFYALLAANIENSADENKNIDKLIQNSLGSMQVLKGIKGSFQEKLNEMTELENNKNSLLLRVKEHLDGLKLSPKRKQGYAESLGLTLSACFNGLVTPNLKLNYPLNFSSSQGILGFDVEDKREVLSPDESDFAAKALLEKLKAKDLEPAYIARIKEAHEQQSKVIKSAANKNLAGLNKVILDEVLKKNLDPTFIVSKDTELLTIECPIVIPFQDLLKRLDAVDTKNVRRYLEYLKEENKNIVSDEELTQLFGVSVEELKSTLSDILVRKLSRSDTYKKIVENRTIQSSLNLKDKLNFDPDVAGLFEGSTSQPLYAFFDKTSLKSPGDRENYFTQILSLSRLGMNQEKTADDELAKVVDLHKVAWLKKKFFKAVENLKEDPQMQDEIAEFIPRLRALFQRELENQTKELVVLLGLDSNEAETFKDLLKDMNADRFNLKIENLVDRENEKRQKSGKELIKTSELTRQSALMVRIVELKKIAVNLGPDNSANEKLNKDIFSEKGMGLSRLKELIKECLTFSATGEEGFSTFKSLLETLKDQLPSLELDKGTDQVSVSSSVDPSRIGVSIKKITPYYQGVCLILSFIEMFLGSNILVTSPEVVAKISTDIRNYLEKALGSSNLPVLSEITLSDIIQDEAIKEFNITLADAKDKISKWVAEISKPAETLENVSQDTQNNKQDFHILRDYAKSLKTSVDVFDPATYNKYSLGTQGETKVSPSKVSWIEPVSGWYISESGINRRARVEESLN